MNNYIKSVLLVCFEHLGSEACVFLMMINNWPHSVVSSGLYVPSERARVSFTRLLMPSSSDVVAVSTVPPSVSRSSFSSCVIEKLGHITKKNEIK